MKRKLQKISKLERRKERELQRREESSSEEEDIDVEEKDLVSSSSDEDDEGSDVDVLEKFIRPNSDDEEQEEKQPAGAEESSEDSDDDEEEEEQEQEQEQAQAEKKKKVKGALSEKDRKIMAERRKEISRIENIVPYRNKQRVLIFCSRGVTSRFRHLMEDMRVLLPHHKKEPKHDTKRNLFEINELCESKQCNGCMFFEARKSKDLYMWLSKTPNGPSVKFHVLNIHTMDELRLSGNCLKGSRPLLSFSPEFEQEPVLQLIKEIFSQIFGTPRGHPKSKPFIDHVMTFSILDGKIWFRHFQITDTTHDPAEIRRALKNGEETTKLVEIGPRFVLDLIKVFQDSFGGMTLCQNLNFVTPTVQRSKKRTVGYKKRKQEKDQTKERQESLVLPRDPIKELFR